MDKTRLIQLSGTEMLRRVSQISDDPSTPYPKNIQTEVLTPTWDMSRPQVQKAGLLYPLAFGPATDINWFISTGSPTLNFGKLFREAKEFSFDGLGYTAQATSAQWEGEVSISMRIKSEQQGISMNYCVHSERLVLPVGPGQRKRLATQPVKFAHGMPIWDGTSTELIIFDDIEFNGIEVTWTNNPIGGLITVEEMFLDVSLYY